MAVKPNLPEYRVKKVLMSTHVSYLKEHLQNLDIEVISTDNIKTLLPFEQNHADMQFLPIDQTTAAAISGSSINCKLKKLYKTFIPIILKNDVSYPNNVVLNHAVIGNYVLGNKKALPKELMEIFDIKKMKFIDIRQGYAKCSTAIINENAVITADVSIYEACLKLGFDALKITPGHINLPGVDYGFIGGCCGKISKNLLAFTGNINLHPDGLKIKEFCNYHGVKTLNLSDNPLIDIGGIIPIE